MFGYALSIAVAFLVFSTAFNIYLRVNPHKITEFDIGWVWFLVVVASILWVIAVPLSLVLAVMLLLKKVSDKIVDFLLKRFKK